MDRGDEESGGLQLTADAMRRLGYRAVDALVDRWEALPEEPAWQGGSRGEMEERLGPMAPPPSQGRDPSEVLEEALDRLLPAAARIDHPRFFAFIPSAPTWTSVVGDFLATGFNVFQGTWLASAGPSWVELQVLEWFREWIGLPEGAGGVLTSGGSVANFMAVVVARELAGNPSDPMVYLSDQGHSSLFRAARMAGIPDEGIRVLPTGEGLLLDPDRVRQAVRKDRAAGRTPILLCANGGATNTGRVDPLVDLGRVAGELGVRFHIDAAFGGFAALTPHGRVELEGLGGADTVTLDPHKWLFQPFECGCLMARDPGELTRVFGVRAEYLQDTELGQEQVNFGDRGVQLSRRFRALKIWMTLQTHGIDALRRAVAHGIELAERAEERIRSSPRLELLSPASLGIVLYRFRGRGGDAAALDALNRTIQQRIVGGGYAMISSTRLHERYALRLCILNPRTRWTDVEGVLERVEEIGMELQEAEAGTHG